jgi:hypothetical protein
LKYIAFEVREGKIEIVVDEEIESKVLEISGDNVSQNYITCPADSQRTLGIKLPIINFVVKAVNSPRF